MKTNLITKWVYSTLILLCIGNYANAANEGSRKVVCINNRVYSTSEPAKLNLFMKEYAHLYLKTKDNYICYVKFNTHTPNCPPVAYPLITMNSLKNCSITFPNFGAHANFLMSLGISAQGGIARVYSFNPNTPINSTATQIGGTIVQTIPDLKQQFTPRTSTKTK